LKLALRNQKFHHSAAGLVNYSALAAAFSSSFVMCAQRILRQLLITAMQFVRQPSGELWSMPTSRIIVNHLQLNFRFKHEAPPGYRASENPEFCISSP
jgi:hypothetical protein